MIQTAIPRDSISLTVNGERMQLKSGMTISELLAHFDLHPQMVVVEHNRSILRDREGYSSLRLAEGDTVELVHFVGGG